MEYLNLSRIYDQMMIEMDYEGWIGGIQKVFSEHGLTSGTILDAGCGTGSFAIPLALSNWNMIGMDKSAEMLSIASEKSSSADVTFPLVQGDITHFDFENSLGGIICLLDTVNHLTKLSHLEKFLKSSFRSLKNNGVLLFDYVNDESLRDYFEDGFLVDDRDNYLSLWNITELSEKNYEIDMTIFLEENESGLYQRYQEVFEKRSFSREEMENSLKKAGFKKWKAITEEEFSGGQGIPERIFIIAEKFTKGV